MDTPPSEIFPSKSYALTGKIMVVAIVVLFSVMILILLLHLYARWYLRQRQPRHVITHNPRHVIFHSPDSSSSPRGLDKAVLASLPIVEYAHEEAGAYSTALPLLEECSVCLSEFETGEKLRLLPKCGHGFHIDCIDMWFHSHATCPVCRSVVEKIDGELVLTGRVKPGSNSGLCATCHSNATVEKIRAEFGLPGRVGSGSCATCHICVSTVEQSAHTESGLSGQDGTGSCATCHIGICTSTFEQSANAESGLLGSGSTVTCESTSMLGDKSWRNGRIRIEVPSRTELKSESGFSSPASQGFWTPGKRILSLNRIFSMGKRSTQDSPVVGDGPSCDRNEIDLECGVNEPTQHSRAHTPR